MFKAGVLVEEPLLPAGALKLKADVPMDGEPEGVLKLNAELPPVAGGVDGLLDAPNVISEAERLRELERSGGGAVNELISEACLLMVVGDACDPKPGIADAEVLGELKLKALFVVGEAAEAEGSPNTNG